MDRANQPTTRVIDILKWNKVSLDMDCILYYSPDGIHKEILLDIPVRDLDTEHLLQDAVDHSLDFEFNYVFIDVGHELEYVTEAYDYDWVCHDICEEDD